MKRRIVLQSLTAGGVALVAAGLLGPRRLWAAWPEQAFEAENMNDALQALFDGEQAEETSAIELKAPDIAENGAVVPVSVSTGLPGVESISILVENNPAPLAASFDLTPEMLPEVSTRLKMGETSNVVAMVRSEGKLYMTKKEVRVTIGGCGG